MCHLPPVSPKQTASFESAALLAAANKRRGNTMRARLLSRSGAFTDLTEEVTGDVLVGRSKECTVQLKSSLISSRHAKISLDKKQQEFFLEDLGSLNGTEIDGVPLRGRERLGRLHVIRLSGRFDLIWQGTALCTHLPGRGKPPEAPAYSDKTIEEKLPPAIPAQDPSQTLDPADLNKTLMDVGALDLQAILRRTDNPDELATGTPSEDAEDSSHVTESNNEDADNENTTDGKR